MHFVVANTLQLSLYGAESITTWNAGSNGTSVSFNRTLPDIYLAGYGPSISYGLHVGSFRHNVKPSLVISGYDSSRCLTEPIVSDKQSLQLTKVTLEVSSGGSAYLDAPSPSTNLLENNGNQIQSLEVYPNSAVPYLYLPKDTCDALAAHLPVTYDGGFNLYFWNTEDPAYQQIVSSPHYIGFTFSSTNGVSSMIKVPFAVLNLTLESPLKSTPTPYFPCAPWTPSSAPYHLGRAFLQAAFISQNWQSSRLFLAQAPGPDFLPPFIKTIASTDKSITPATNPPNWESTWSNTLKALPDNVSNSAGNKSGSGGLSGGVIAGIVVGVIAVVAILAGALIWFMRRRKRQWPAAQQEQQQQPGQEVSHAGAYQPPSQDGDAYAYKRAHGPPPVYEAEAISPPAEMDAGGNLGELPANHVGRQSVK